MKIQTDMSKTDKQCFFPVKLLLPCEADCQLTSKMQLVTSHLATSRLALYILQLVTGHLQLGNSHPSCNLTGD